MEIETLSYNMPANTKIKPMGDDEILLFCNETGFQLPPGSGLIVHNPYGNLEFLENCILDEQHKQRLIDQGLYIFLNEPINSYNADNEFEDFFSDFVGNERQLNALELDNINQFVMKNSLTDVTVFTCDYNVSKHYSHYTGLKLRCLDMFLMQFIKFHDSYLPPITRCISETKKTSLNYKFASTTWRFTNDRLVINSLLIHHETLISWYFKCDKQQLDDIPWLDTDTKNDMYKNIVSGISKLNQEVPLCLDVELDTPTLPDTCILPVDNTGVPVENPSDTNRYNNKLLGYYRQVFVDVVNESRFGQPTANISEKTFQAIQYMTPFILVAPPHTLEYLKRLGFKTFDRWWDESYDLIECHYSRICKINDIIEYISNKSFEELNDIYSEMNDILIHNYATLYAYKKTNKVTNVYG